MEVFANSLAGNNGNLELNELNSKSTLSSLKVQKNIRRNVHKLLTVLCCSMGIIVAWTIALAPALLYTILTDINRSNSDILYNQTSSIPNNLPQINLPNISNYSIYRIQCENRFIFDPKESVCYPPCDWDPSGTSLPLINSIIYFIISFTALILCVGTLISWIITSVKCRGGNKGCDFQLARASLFMIVLSRLAWYLTLACTDILGRERLVCRSNGHGGLYFTAHMLFSLSSNSDTRLVVNILGLFYTFWFLFTLLWTIIGFTNVVLLVLLSSHIRSTQKRQIVAFSIELAITVIVPICILSVVTGVDPISTFVFNYPIQELAIRNMIAFIILKPFVYSLTSGYVLTAVIIILTKLRFISLRSEKIIGQKIQLTTLEKRMILYAVVLGLLYSSGGIQAFFYPMIESQFITRVFNYTLCVNANSPITLIPREYTGSIQNISTINSTLTVYRGNNTGNLTECSRILNELDATVPVWSFNIFGILVRLEGMLVFIVLIPRFSISCFKKLLRIK